MNIDALSPQLFLTPAMPAQEPASSPETSFGHWLGEKVSETNHQLNAADTALTKLATGQTENLHQTMITFEEAKLSFQYLEQIRNRLMSAYQELLREQI